MVIFFLGGGVLFFHSTCISACSREWPFIWNFFIQDCYENCAKFDWNFFVVLAMDNKIFTHELSFKCFSLNLVFIHLPYLYIRTLGLNKLDFPVQKRWICCTKFGWYFSNDSGDKCIIFNVVKNGKFAMRERCVF